MTQSTCDQCGRRTSNGTALCGSCVPEYIPTPADIAEACATIQAGWTAKERAIRSGKQFGPRFRVHRAG